MTLTHQDLTWMFKDPEWKQKFLIGSLLALAGLVPGLNLLAWPILFGYALQLMRGQMRGEPRALPRWNDYGQLLVDGVKGWFAEIGYTLPGLVIMFGGMFVWIIFTFVSMGAAASAGSGRTGSSFFPFIFLSQLVMFFFFAIGWLVSLIGMVFGPVALGQYLRTGRVGAGYRWSEVWRILNANAGGYALAWLVYFGITMGLSFVVSLLYYTIILCCLIPFLLAPVQFYTMLLYAQFFGATYRTGVEKAALLNPNLPGLATS